MKKKDKSGWINPFGTPLEAQEQISTGDLLGPAACTIPIFVHRAFEFFRKFNGNRFLEKIKIWKVWRKRVFFESREGTMLLIL